MKGIMADRTWKDLVFALASACSDDDKTVSNHVYVYDIHEMLNAEINIEHYEGDEYVTVYKRGEGDTYYEILRFDDCILAARLMALAEEIAKLCMLKGDYSIWKNKEDGRWHVRHDDWELFIENCRGIDEFMTELDTDAFSFAELRRFLSHNDIKYDYEIDLPF